jgi:hypothetical protein
LAALAGVGTGKIRHLDPLFNQSPLVLSIS